MHDFDEFRRPGRGPGDPLPESDPTELAAGTPNVEALRRRVLLTGLLTFALFFLVTYLLALAGAPDWTILPAAVLGYVLVVRPLMRPVREAVRLRRRLAYQAWLDAKDDGRE